MSPTIARSIIACAAPWPKACCIPATASSARALAVELGLARGTVESAYSLLAAEGYIEARGQAGTVVAAGVQTRPPGQAATAGAPSVRARQRPQTMDDTQAQSYGPRPSRWGSRRWMRFHASCGRGWARASHVPPSRPTCSIRPLRTATAAHRNRPLPAGLAGPGVPAGAGLHHGGLSRFAQPGLAGPVATR
jgi:hypothetical protein